MKLMNIGFSQTGGPFWESVEEGVKAAGFEYYYYAPRTVVKNLRDAIVKKTGTDPTKARLKAIDMMQADTLSTIDRYKPDVIIIFKADFTFTETIKRIREKVKHVIFWIYDDPGWVLRDREDIVNKCQYFDVVWTCAESSQNYYRDKLGIKESVLFYPGCNPNHHNEKNKESMTQKERDYYKADICFAGTWDIIGSPNRAEVNSRLMDIAERNGLTYKLWGGHPGTRWGIKDDDSRTPKYLKPWVDEHEIWKIYSNTKVCVNTRNWDNMPADKYFDAKTFQILGCKSLLMTYKEKGCPDIFKHGSEVVFWDSLDDMEKKVLQFVRNNELRERVAAAGQRAVYDRYNLAKNIEDELTRLKGVWNLQ